MAVAGTVLNPFSNPLSISNSKSNPRIKTLRTLTTKQLYNINSSPLSTTIFFSPHFKTKFQVKSLSTHFSPKASSSTVGNPDYIVEPATDVKFQKSLTLPGCQNLLVFLGSGFREKVFAIIGVKVYGAGFYANQSVIEILKESRSKSPNEIQGDSSLYDSIYQAPMEKSLQIVLVRDVDGKTFWNALDEAVSPRIQSPTPVDESALSTFRGIFDGRSLKKGTLIFLTWLNPSKMLICISSNGLPSTVDATIESQNVTFALFDVFFGDTPVSPTLKASVSNGCIK